MPGAMMSRPENAERIERQHAVLCHGEGLEATQARRNQGSPMHG